MLKLIILTQPNDIIFHFQKIKRLALAGWSFIVALLVVFPDMNMFLNLHIFIFFFFQCPRSTGN